MVRTLDIPPRAGPTSSRLFLESRRWFRHQQTEASGLFGPSMIAISSNRAIVGRTSMVISSALTLNKVANVHADDLARADELGRFGHVRYQETRDVGTEDRQADAAGGAVFP